MWICRDVRRGLADCLQEIKAATARCNISVAEIERHAQVRMADGGDLPVDFRDEQARVILGERFDGQPMSRQRSHFPEVRVAVLHGDGHAQFLGALRQALLML